MRLGIVKLENIRFRLSLRSPFLIFVIVEQKETTHKTFGAILRLTGMLGSVHGFGILSSLVRNKLTAVLLGPAGMGLISLYNTALKLVSDISNLGIPTSSVKCMAEVDTGRQKEIVRLTRSLTLFTAVAGMLLMCLCAPLLSRAYFGEEGQSGAFVALSVVVLLSIFSAGEIAVLKGTGFVRAIAHQGVIASVGAVLIVLPFYYYRGVEGIVPALITLQFFVAGVVSCFSMRKFPYRIGIPDKAHYHRARAMVRVGLAFLLTGAVSSAFEFSVRSYMMNFGSLADVGFYNSGYFIVTTYAAVFFAGLDSDFYPQLSSVKGNAETSALVNARIIVTMQLLSPMLLLFMAAMPLIIPLVYSERFLPAVGYSQLVVLSVLFRGVTLPLEYIALARGRGFVYFLTEGCYSVLTLAGVIVGYHFYGLNGAGWGMAMASAFSLLADCLIVRHYFGYVLTFEIVRLLAECLLLHLAVLAAMWLLPAGWSVGITVALVAAGLWRLWLFVRNRTDLLKRKKQKKDE